MENPNTFDDYVDNREGVIYIDSNYEFLLRKVAEVTNSTNRIVEDLYKSRKFNLEVYGRLQEDLSELKKWENMLNVAKQIEDMNMIAHLPKDPDLAEFIENAQLHVEYYRNKTNDTESSIAINDKNVEKKYQNPIIMGKIHEDAINEDNKRVENT